MNFALNAVSLAFLVGLVFYVSSLVIIQIRRAVFADARFKVEYALLSEQIEQIVDRRNFERERSELSWNGYRKFEVHRKELETKDVCSFYLRPHDGKKLPPFEPGQFLTFQLDHPDEIKQLIRCYSLSDSPNHPDYYRVTIKRVPPPPNEVGVPPGLSSNFFHDWIMEGDILDVKAPSGHFFLDTAKQSPVVLIGGGVGLTPVLSMLNWIAESESKRETYFFYGVTNSNDHAMKEHLKQIGIERENIHLHVCYSRPEEGDLKGEDYHHQGRISVNLFESILPNKNFDFYLCGPPPMMKAVVSGLEEWGVPNDQIHSEAFGPASVPTIKNEESQIVGTSQSMEPITVTFSRSGKVVDWQPDAGSLLDFAESQGIDIPSGCRAGNCGTCITAIKDGHIVYLNEPGSPPELGSCLACISIPKESLIIDA